MRVYDAAVVGGGIVGVACAASLAKAGLRAVIIEASGIASGTTAAGMGHIVVMDDSNAQFELTRYSQSLWKELAQQLPRSAEYDNCGTIWIASSEAEMTDVARKNEYYAKGGVASEVLDEKALREAEPGLREDLAGGLLVQEDSVIYQLSAANSLLNTAGKRVEVLLGKQAVQLSETGVKLADGQFIAAGKIINAAGVAAAALSPGLNI